MFKEGRAGLCEHGFAPESVEELVTNFSFKIYNLLTQRRLRYITVLGCSGEIAEIGDGHDVSQLLEFHM